MFFGLRAVPTITVFSERVSEYNAYLRTTAIGGIASVDWRRFRRTPVTFAYSMDLGRTEAQPALFCAVFNICDQEDRRRVQETQRLAVVSAIVSHDNSNSVFSPTAGSQWRLEARHASPITLSDSSLRFSKLLAERSQYWGIADGAVIAFRIRGGAVIGRSLNGNTGFIPPQERLVRRRSDDRARILPERAWLGDLHRAQLRGHLPEASLLDGYTLQCSGRGSVLPPVGAGWRKLLLVSNLELRLRSPFLADVLQWTLFTDAGDVWNRGQLGGFQNFRIKVTPGNSAHCAHRLDRCDW